MASAPSFGGLRGFYFVLQTGDYAEFFRVSRPASIRTYVNYEEKGEMHLPITLIFLGTFVFVRAVVPPWPSTYELNASTIIMPCSFHGMTDPATISRWGITSFDWSNDLFGWSAALPMDTDERLLAQVKLSKTYNPSQHVWIYRNSVYGYPWFTSVRTILDDPAYAPWFIMFSSTGPWYSPKCDTMYSPPLCTEYFHTQMDTPRPDHHGYGQCAPPACNCGTKPCGFYVFNHSSTAVINGQTFRDWFIDDYMLNEIGMDALVTGFFHDDFWSPSGNMGDNTPNATRDMGLTPNDLLQLTIDYNATMAELRTRILSVGKFTWQMLWTGGPAGQKGSTCPTPLVGADPAKCAADLTAYCAPGALPQAETLLYSFSPGGCGGDPGNLTNAAVDIANFLLIRGDYAFIGQGWESCSRNYEFPSLLDTDVGVPLGSCAPIGADVFERNYTKVTVRMNCATGVPTITPR